MRRYLIRRLAQGAVVLFVVSAVVFAIVHAAPGGPALLNNPDVDPKMAKEMEKQLGLDDPIPVQYARWLGNALRGNLGRSYQHSLGTAELLWARIPNTLLLSGTALLLAVVLAVPLGMISAVYRYSALDYAATVTAFVGVSIPVFWLAILLIIVFSVTLGWLPSSGMLTVGVPFSMRDRFLHLLMPSIVLATFPLAQLTRYVRSSMVDALAQDYVRTARAKGVPERRVVLRHQLRNALLSFITRFGLAFPFLLTGAVLIETIFAWPGMGRLAFNAILARDHTLVTATALIASVVVVLGNLVADILLEFADPRLRVRADVITEIVTV